MDCMSRETEGLCLSKMHSFRCFQIAHAVSVMIEFLRSAEGEEEQEDTHHSAKEVSWRVSSPLIGTKRAPRAISAERRGSRQTSGAGPR